MSTAMLVAILAWQLVIQSVSLKFPSAVHRDVARNASLFLASPAHWTYALSFAHGLGRLRGRTYTYSCCICGQCVPVLMCLCWQTRPKKNRLPGGVVALAGVASLHKRLGKWQAMLDFLAVRVYMHRISVPLFAVHIGRAGVGVSFGLRRIESAQFGSFALRFVHLPCVFCVSLFFHLV